MLEQLFPFGSKRFAKEIPCFVRELVGGGLERSETFVQILLQRYGATVLGEGVTTRQSNGEIGPEKVQQSSWLRQRTKFRVGVEISHNHHRLAIERRKSPGTEYP